MPQRKSSTAPVIAGLGFGLAAGVTLGVLGISPLLGAAVDTGSENFGAIREEYRKSLQDLHESTAQARAGDGVISDLAAEAVKGILKDRPVLLLTTSNADPADVAAIEQLLKEAGATNSGKIALADRFFDQDEADHINTLVSAALPAGATLSTTDLRMGTHAGEALGAALLLDAQTTQPLATVNDRAALLKTLKSKEYISYNDGTILPGQAILVVDGQTTGAKEDAFKAEQLAALVTSIDKVGHNTVFAARLGSAAQEGSIGRLRAGDKNGEKNGEKNDVSTVDSIDFAWARIGAVLAVREQLEGGAGKYGAAKGVDAATPPLKPRTSPKDLGVAHDSP